MIEEIGFAERDSVKAQQGGGAAAKAQIGGGQARSSRWSDEEWRKWTSDWQDAQDREERRHRQEEDDRVPCPHCGRRFSILAAERHIPKCTSIMAKPKTLTRGGGGQAVATGRGPGGTVGRGRGGFGGGRMDGGRGPHPL